MGAIAAVRDYGRDVVDGWDRFWFTPRMPHTLAAMRIATGVMLLYAHCVWALNLADFLGSDAWIGGDIARRLHAEDAAWSYLWWMEDARLLWMHHALTLAVMFAFAIGLATRLTAPAAWLLQLMYVHRLTGALFGLDQVVTMLVMYLMLSPCGAVYSVDAVLRRRIRGGEARRFLRWLLPGAGPSMAAGIATRLLQLHLCVIYLFGGIGKMRGEMWWDGTAMWFAAASYEYQSFDLTWLGRFPVLFAAASHLTVFWETFYAALVWPRLTRPWVLGIAVLVHGGIATFLGMITFGTMMIVANAAFVPPAMVERLVGRLPGVRRRHRRARLASGEANAPLPSAPQRAPRRHRRAGAGGG